jgi:hypothetical protein
LIGLQNKARDRAISLAFSVKDLPFVTLWKNTNLETEGYVTGLEPGTNYPYNRRVERAHGRVPTLRPGESHFAAIDFTIHPNAGETRELAQRIARLQGAIQPVIDAAPEK